jgi:hypothetical protein
MFRKKLQLGEVNTMISNYQKGNMIIQLLTNTNQLKEKSLKKVHVQDHNPQNVWGRQSRECKGVSRFRVDREGSRKGSQEVERVKILQEERRAYLELKSAMPTTEIPHELRAIIMFDGGWMMVVEGLEETVVLGKVDMNTKDTLLLPIEKAMNDVLGQGVSTLCYHGMIALNVVFILLNIVLWSLIPAIYQLCW